MSTQYSSLSTFISSRGNITYQLELSHAGLRKHRLIKGDDAYIVQRKAQLQADEWDETWKRKLKTQARQQSRQDKKLHQEEQKQLAADLTREATETLESLRNTLPHTLAARSKITQASRDGGVDAVAFDPDPIRGGKIVIQAKRYTNTVGVAAVRDLYGTVMNEGATKGILVTTSDYGPDAYEFANGKPLTLLNGANLLHCSGSTATRQGSTFKKREGWP